MFSTVSGTRHGCLFTGTCKPVAPLSMLYCCVIPRPDNRDFSQSGLARRNQPACPVILIRSLASPRQQIGHRLRLLGGLKTFRDQRYGGAFRLGILVRGSTSEAATASAKVTVSPVSAAITPVREPLSMTSTLNAAERVSIAALGSNFATRKSTAGRP